MLKICYIDVENSPNLGYTWDSYDQNVIAFKRKWYMMSCSVFWEGDKKPITKTLADFDTYKEFPHHDYDLMLWIWEQLDKADIVIGHNGDKHDLRKINARFAFHHLSPPDPYQTIDTLKVARRGFAFPKNSLKELAEYLGTEHQKLDAGGFTTWEACMEGDLKAWAKMKKYNSMDTVVLRDVYMALRPWIKSHPNVNMDGNANLKCPVCGSANVIKRGPQAQKTRVVQRYSCNDCGKPSVGEYVPKQPGVILK